MSRPLLVLFATDDHVGRFDAVANGKIEFVGMTRILDFDRFVRGRSIVYVNIDNAPSPCQGDVDRAMRAGACQAQLVAVCCHDLCDFSFEELLAGINAGQWHYSALKRTAYLVPMEGA